MFETKLRRSDTLILRQIIQKTQSNSFEFFYNSFFCLETKEPKIQDLETPAKISNKFLKFPKLGRKQDLSI